MSESALLLRAATNVQIYLDDGGNLSETQYVRDRFLPEATIFQQPEHVTVPSGCWNILNAFKGGYESGADIVCLVEEDVMIYPNFFIGHRLLQTILYPQPLAVCGRYIERYGKDYYTNPGSSMSRSLLDRLVPHINDEFFKDTSGYMLRHFPEWQEASSLDDGLIRRVMRQSNAQIRFTPKRMAAHQGYKMFGKNDDNRTTGDIEQRIEQLRVILQKIDCQDRYYRDFEPYDQSRKIPALG